MARPAKKWRVGSASVAMWVNEKGRKSFKVETSYKNREGQWQSSEFFGLRDLGNAICALQVALIENCQTFGEAKEKEQDAHEDSDVIDDSGWWS